MAAPSSTSSARAAAADSFATMAPVMVGMAPFGLVAGIVAVEAGLEPWGALVYSTFIFAGASQLAALDLLGQGAAVGVIIGTVAVINARMVMYSASLALPMARESTPRRALMAYLLTDQAYALAIAKLAEHPDHPHRFAYYLGGAAPLWLCWQTYTLVGAVAGSAVPDEVPLEFAIPLVFAALLVPAVTNRPTLAAAVTSATVATLAADLPANTGLLLAAFGGIAVGWTVSRRLGEGAEGAPGEDGDR